MNDSAVRRRLDHDPVHAAAWEHEADAAPDMARPGFEHDRVGDKAADPWTELARLVDGRDDPFRDVFDASPARPSAPQPASARAPEAALPDWDRGWSAEQAAHSAGVEAPSDDLAVTDHEDGRSFAGTDYAPEAAFGDENALPPEELGRRAPRSRKPVFIVGAMLVIGLGVVGAGLYARGRSPELTSQGAPLIKAAEGPAKIQPASPGGVEVPNQDSGVLDKNGNGKPPAPVRVVSREEQPVDLGQVPKTAGQPAATAPQGAAPTPFPEPKKVKTVSVRPDGSVVSDAAPGAPTAAPGAPAAPTPTVPSLVTQPRPTAMTAPATSTPQPKAATPKTTVRVQPTPKPETTNQAAADTTDGAPAPMQLGAASRPRPGAAGSATPVKAVKVASNDATATTAPAATTAGGGFAVQLAAPGTEQEARDASARIQRKYAGELGSYRPSVRKAEAGEKTVYRVRVGNLSRDDANALCAKLKAGGGECFVAKN